ncbi:ComEC/Rec2 family competence protein [Patescibacteria group bacterium]|nr:ComEC/Rec2 family competence protein [Patescibacteria group bacterium]
MSEQYDDLTPEERGAKRREIADNRQARAQGGNELAHLAPRSSDVTYRVDDSSGVSILLLAAFFDILSFLPVLNMVVTPVSQIFIFPLVFFFHNISVVGKKNWIWYLLAWVIEMIPFVSMFPTITLMAFRIIAISRIEDKLGALNLVANTRQAKAAARLTMQKGRQAIADQERRAVEKAGQRKDGTKDADKSKEKQGRITDRRADLNKSLSGMKSGKNDEYMNYATGEDAKKPRWQGTPGNRGMFQGDQKMRGAPPQSAPASDNFSGVDRDE